jgi:hypothetical protein
MPIPQPLPDPAAEARTEAAARPRRLLILAAIVAVVNLALHTGTNLMLAHADAALAAAQADFHEKLNPAALQADIDRLHAEVTANGGTGAIGKRGHSLDEVRAQARGACTDLQSYDDNVMKLVAALPSQNDEFRALVATTQGAVGKAESDAEQKLDVQPMFAADSHPNSEAIGAAMSCLSRKFEVAALQNRTTEMAAQQHTTLDSLLEISNGIFYAMWALLACIVGYALYLRGQLKRATS